MTFKQQLEKELSDEKQRIKTEVKTKHGKKIWAMRIFIPVFTATWIALGIVTNNTDILPKTINGVVTIMFISTFVLIYLYFRIGKKEKKQLPINPTINYILVNKHGFVENSYFQSTRPYAGHRWDVGRRVSIDTVRKMFTITKYSSPIFGKQELVAGEVWYYKISEIENIAINNENIAPTSYTSGNASKSWLGGVNINASTTHFAGMTNYVVVMVVAGETHEFHFRDNINLAQQMFNAFKSLCN